MSGCCRGLPAKVCWARPYGCSNEHEPEPYEDPGTCTRCGEPFELVRPGKAQPTCACWEVSDGLRDPE